MAKHKRTDLLCGLGTAVMLVLTVLYLCCSGFLTAAAVELPYVDMLFSTDKVHKIDIVASESDWQTMLDNASSEEYISCTAVIDGEKYANVGIRPKGNSSLRTVANSDSDRYSFKLEFDHYDKNSTYHGLDKLCLNNAIQDNTYMKDFLCYQMMNFLGADAPLSSFVWITVNGEDWGLYTAVEGVEDSFAQRKYGADHGELYKPDSLDMGGGGRGAEARDRTEAGWSEENTSTLPENSRVENGTAGNTTKSGGRGFGKMVGMGAPGGMGGSDDVLLRYSDDDPDSYPNIFDNTVLGNVTDKDKARLIQSLKALSQGNVEESVNIDEVLRYFAVHNFVLNEDSYTGTMIHNYYLYEENGLLSMIAWDYNLAFGGMGGGMGTSGATSMVNSPIDSPVTSGELSERPMVAWIFEKEQYTEQYHRVMDELISGFFESGEFTALMEQTVALISPYVERDPTAFCTYEEFQKAVETLKNFCLLRSESVRGQLSGTIPSTSEGQAEDSGSLIDVGELSLSDMGSQGDMGGFRQGDRQLQTGGGQTTSAQDDTESEGDTTGEAQRFSGEQTFAASGMGDPPLGDLPTDGQFDGRQPGAAPPDQGGDFPEMDTPPEQNGTATPPNSGEENNSSESGADEPAAPTEEQDDTTGSQVESTPQQGGDPLQNGAPPNGMGGGFPGGFPDAGNAPMEAQGGNTNLETIILLGASAIILLGGLLFARFYR